MKSTCNNLTTVSSKEEAYKNQLEKLECPFTWNMDIILSHRKHLIDEKFNLSLARNSPPLQIFLFTIMTVYLDVKDHKTWDIIEDDLKKCHGYLLILDDDILKNRNDPEISTKVAKAVLQATECWVYFELNKEEDLKRLLNDLENLDNISDKEKSILLGCKSMCWSRYDKNISISPADDFIRKAIMLNENCALWHYILGKIIHKKKRALSIAGPPCDEEAKCFSKAYEMSKHPFYGISVAQMYRERGQYDDARKICDHLYENREELNIIALLRLVLAFINQNELGKAKNCLDKAEKSQANFSMYFHYKAKYHLKERQFRQAEDYFKKAIEDDNLFAELEYFQYRVKSQKDFDATKCLLDMLDKYKSWPEKQLQTVFLHVAFSYWKRECNLKKAIEYFLKAITIDPKAKCLTRYYNNDIYYPINCVIRDRNVYYSLEKHFFPEFDDQNRQLIEKVDAIKNFCNLNREAQINSLENSFTAIKLKK